MLLGSAISLNAGMPGVADITRRILSGDGVWWAGSRWRVREQLQLNHEMLRQGLPDIREFLAELKLLSDDYFAERGKEREPNYEDIAYVAKQIEDGLGSEYENPALPPLIQSLERRFGDDLYSVAEAAANYIDDVVRSLLERPAGPFDHLTAIVDGARDPAIDSLTIATLNHDTVLERAFQLSNHLSDGFADPFGQIAIWNDHFTIPSRRLLKLHGSIDWWRYRPTRDGWEGQFFAKTIEDSGRHDLGP